MIGYILKFKKTIYLCLIVFVVGIASGVYITKKFYAIGKINMLESYIDKQAKSHNKTIINLESVHKANLKIAEDNIKIKEVTKYVKDNRKCDLTINAVKLLDNSRTGLPDTSTITDEALRQPAVITQRQQIESCARDGIQYRNLKASHDGLRQWYMDNWR